MSSIVTSVLIGAAANVGAPLIKEILSRKFGKTGDLVADTIIGVVADKAGVTADKLHECSTNTLENAILAAEADVPAILEAGLKQQEQSNALMLAEMHAGKKKEAAWIWAWRPFWMWLLGAFWIFHVFGIGAIYMITGKTFPSPATTDLFYLTAAYLSLYMGGHTVKSAFDAFWTARK